MKKPKYNTSTKKKDKPVYNGISFDSKDEMLYYQFLESEVEKKRIAHFDHQVKMVLIDKYQIFLKKVRAAEIVIDFRVFLADGSVIYQDVKGFPSEKAKLQRKIFEWRYGVPLQWITHSNIDGGWIDYDELKKRRAKRKLEGKK